MKRYFNNENNNVVYEKEIITMKRIIALFLSIIMLCSFLSVNGITAFAEEECNCCEDCTNSYKCTCHCGCCDYCSYEDDDNGDDGDDDYGDDDYGDGDDGDGDDGDGDDDQPVDEGKDPVEKETEYSQLDMMQDISNININQACGDSMLWYVKGKTLYIFGSGEMYDYSDSTPAPWADLDITKVVFRKGISSVGSYAFYNSNLKNVELSSTITEIKEGAFSYCRSLVNLVLNKNLISVGTSAFSDCKGLKQVTLNNDLVELGSFAFRNCTSLTHVRFPSTLSTISYGAFFNCTALKRVILREGLTGIGEYAFLNCNNMSSAVLPSTLTTIAYAAFSGCENLSEIDFSKSVAEIQNNAFDGCAALKSLNFGKLVTIGDKAFANSGVTSVTVSKSLCNIGKDIFLKCSKVNIDVKQNAYAYKTFKKLKNATVVCKVHDNCSSTTVKATFKADGKINGSVCRACGYETSVKTIYQIKDVSLSKSYGVYNGKSQLPTIKVKDRTNKTISNSNYSVSFSSGFKNVGEYKVTVKFKNNYSGSKTLTYTIKPASTSISSVTANSKGFKLKWKKQSAQTSGYEIQYSKNSNFSAAKTVAVANSSTVSKSISKLYGKKKYYVRVRTYKVVNNKKYYSSWSKSKSITTKV